MNRTTVFRCASWVCLGVGLASIAAGQSGYRVSEDYNPNPSTADAGPVRMARFGLIEGQGVVWRPNGDSDWSNATQNLPVRQGAQVWVAGGSRADLQFDDGSILHLGSHALVSLTTLYSDSNGEFTEIKLNDGLASMKLASKYSLYQIDTPDAAAKAYGPARFRLGVGQGVEIADRSGEVLVDGAQGKTQLHERDYAYIADANSPVQVSSLPGEDSWDQFADRRDEFWDHRDPNLPPNIALVTGDLSAYGRWGHDEHYGAVWYPHVSDPGWRPYERGHWVWLSPYGWTWVGDESWGWAPYHYGTWVMEPDGWAWVPGPVTQYWSPAVVQYCGDPNVVAWCPLAPQDVVYPSALTIGFSGGNWALSFSIGRSGCYFPSGGYCVGRPWSNVYVNRTTNIYNITQVNNYYGSYRTNAIWKPGGRFVPRNARYAVYTNPAGFSRGGSFRPLPAARTSLFRTGRSFVGGPSSAGGPQIAGPPNVRPTVASFTPLHRAATGARPDPKVIQRAVYRAPVPNVVAQHSMGVGHVITPGVRSAPIRRITSPSRPAGRTPSLTRPGTRANRVNPGGPMRRPTMQSRPKPANRGSFAASRRAGSRPTPAPSRQTPATRRSAPMPAIQRRAPAPARRASAPGPRPRAVPQPRPQRPAPAAPRPQPQQQRRPSPPPSSHGGGQDKKKDKRGG